MDDNYCDDLVNGCDEPNTSACSLIKKTATFQCQRSVTGEPHMLFSSRVGDGICDCCDGSDEPAGTCPDICEAERAAYIAAAREEYEGVMEGKRLRDAAVVESAQLMAGWQEEIKASLALAKEQEPLLKKLRALKAKEDKTEGWEKFVWYLGERKRKQKEKEEAAVAAAAAAEAAAAEAAAAAAAAAASPPPAEGEGDGEGEGEEGEASEGSTDNEATDVIKPPSYTYKAPEPPKREIKVYTDEDSPAPEGEGEEEESFIAKVLRAATATDGTRTLTLQEYLQSDSSSSSEMPLWEAADILELNLHALGALLVGPFKALAWSVMVCKDELYLKMKWETEWQQKQRKRKFEKSSTNDDANDNTKKEGENLMGFLVNALMKGPETAVSFFRPETIEGAPERLEAALLTYAVGEIENEVEEGLGRVEELKGIMKDSVYGEEADGRVFLTWREKEFEKQDKDHLYKIRPFEDVKQNYVLVGKWKSWIAHDDGRMTVMWFTEGMLLLLFLVWEERK